MDMILVDVTDIPAVTLGDEAVLLGAQGSDRLPVEELARWMGSISYEVLCGIGARVPRISLGRAGPG
jgi:alanine racemase